MSDIPETRADVVERLLREGAPESEVFDRIESSLRKAGAPRLPRLTREEFAGRLEAEVRAGRVRVYVPEVGEA